MMFGKDMVLIQRLNGENNGKNMKLKKLFMDKLGIMNCW